jgi:hypothetical protein
MKWQAPNIESEALRAVPSTPPPEVLAAVGDAAAAYDRLWAAGFRLHFDRDDRTGKLQVQVHDEQGAVLEVLPLSRVVELASGAMRA